MNNKVCDLNQRTVAALDRLAEVYETFEDTWDIVEKESAEGDMLCASEEDAVDKLEAAAPGAHLGSARRLSQEHGQRLQGIQQLTRSSLGSVVRSEGSGSEALRI